MQKTDCSSTAFFLVALFSIYLLGWFLQSNTFVSSDVSWGLHEAKRLLNGGTYGKDFFEVNPPLFLYLYTLPVILAKFIPLSLFTLFQLYVFLLISLSLSCSYLLLKKLLPINSCYYAMSLLAFSLVLLPLSVAFGEREHLFLIFMFPYLFLVACRLQNHKMKTSFAICIGLVAGVGFAIKPFFYLPFVLVELYYAYCQKYWFAWLRPEIFSMIAVTLIYLLSIAVFCPTFLTLVLPLATRLYYQGYSVAWDAVLLNPEFLFCGLSFFLYLACYQINTYKTLSTLLLIAMVGLCGAYVIQRTLWYYHIYPAFSLAILLDVYFLSVFARQKQPPKLFYLQMVFVGLLSLALLEKYQSPVSTFTLYYLGFLCLTSVGIICFRIKNNKPHLAICSVITALILSAPSSFVIGNLTTWLSFQEDSSTLIAFMRLHAQDKPVYFISNTMRIEFPLVDYAKVIPASQYPSLVWFSGYMRQVNSEISTTLRAQLEKDRAYFLNMMANELTTHSPELVFVEAGKMAPVINGHTFDYANDFIKNTRFRAAWKNYRYLTTLSMPDFYQFQVYQRIKRTSA